MRKGFIVTGILWWLVLVFPTAADTGKQLLGDESDGSRAVPVHLIPLYNEEGNKDKNKILPDDDLLLPFSTRQTCCDCHVNKSVYHSYDIIRRGWHFNATDPNVAPGRPGQPWIFADARTGTQIPLSFRPWPGTFRPEQFGITNLEFTQVFGRQMPGGGVGELDSDNPDEIMRQFVSGKLEINCLSCHNADPMQDQAEYADQTMRQNFRWAATAACEFASVKGSAVTQGDAYDYLTSDAIAVTYRENTFDHKNQVFFDIVREVPAERCYFCHSNMVLDKSEPGKWTADEDVHLTAGLTCIDCHRNGLDHNITRGYESEEMVSKNPLAVSSSCEGCHLGKDSSSEPVAGRLGAPVPEHPGIPPVHFDKLTCTACHSGPWPGQTAYRIKTSRAHGLGTHNVNKSDEALPHIMSPVFAKQADGKIGPHNLLWPAYWGSLKEGNVTPVAIKIMRKVAGKVITRKKLSASGDWPSLTDEDIVKILKSLSSQKSIEGKAVYICGGKVYQLDDSGQLFEEEHPAASPYLWPIAHNVRPAAQSLGVRRCEDCHSTDAPFFFGEVAIDSPLASERDYVKRMVEFEDVGAFYTKAFAMSFVFRPWLKVVTLGSCAVLGVVLLLYALKALACIAKILVGED